MPTFFESTATLRMPFGQWSPLKYFPVKLNLQHLIRRIRDWSDYSGGFFWMVLSCTPPQHVLNITLRMLDFLLFTAPFHAS